MTGHVEERYVRVVTFLDPVPRHPHSDVVHVATEIRLDHEPTAVRANLHEPWSITSWGQGATVVSFLVHPADCQIGRRDTDGTHRPATVGGRRVLSPHGQPWCTEHTYDPHWVADASGEPVPQWEWVRVYLLVREAHAACAPALPHPLDTEH